MVINSSLSLLLQCGGGGSSGNRLGYAFIGSVMEKVSFQVPQCSSLAKAGVKSAIKANSPNIGLKVILMALEPSKERWCGPRQGQQRYQTY